MRKKYRFLIGPAGRFSQDSVSPGPSKQDKINKTHKDIPQRPTERVTSEETKPPKPNTPRAPKGPERICWPTGPLGPGLQQQASSLSSCTPVGPEIYGFFVQGGPNIINIKIK